MKYSVGKLVLLRHYIDTPPSSIPTRRRFKFISLRTTGNVASDFSVVLAMLLSSQQNSFYFYKHFDIQPIKCLFLIRWKTITMFLCRILLGTIDFIMIYTSLKIEFHVKFSFVNENKLNRRNVQTLSKSY